MSNLRGVRHWLEDIVEWGGYLEQHIAGMDRADFEADKTVQHAVIKCIEVVGEASGRLMKLLPDHASRFPALDLQRAYAARNKLSHGYFDTDLEPVWFAAIASVPKTVTAAKLLLATMKPEDSA